MLNKLEKKVLASIQNDIPITQYPYKYLSEKINITEECFIKILKDLTNRGVIRRFGATLRHQKSGYKANAMIAWRVENDKIEKVGNIMASFDEVSHCYHRNSVDCWPYNLYSMVHGKTKKECYQVVTKISKKIKVNDYTMLFSTKELKKTSMTYFED